MEDILEVNLEPDFLPYIVGLILFLTTLIVLFTLFRKKRVAKKEDSFAKLKSIDFNGSSKDIAYAFTIYTKELNLNDELLKEILKELEPYKYKKESHELPPKLKDKIREYIKGVLGE